MGEFADVCLGFPTVLFGGALVVVVGFWGLVLVGGADAHGPGHHGAGGGHGVGHGGAHGAAHPAPSGGHATAAHGHVHAGHGPVHGQGHGHAQDHGRGDARPGGDAATGHGLLATAGLDGVPVTVVLSLLIALGWFLSLAGSAALDGAGLHGAGRAVADVALIAAALVGAWLLTWVLVRPLRHLFPYALPPSREDFVGRICVIRTGTVTERFGQAEVTAPDGSTAVVQVRRAAQDTDGILAAGRTALLYAYDPQGEFFWAAPYEDPAGGAPPPGARALP
ncbi:hypothetical protein SAMN05216223_104224 [Actinacidiphila yanglinensis]|uniref:DUF1449 family protein n=1 Tax=Actinacidiphila yanglinensis TaxID=310779 RepID=A0A1H5Z141_9ACTN|nr:hypothetical protein [Actinacidiphila yanglinensis]SEG29305.1 hypothetical protein SAMN05216223_104224 [Actinacidiphila yanglinensis]